MLVRVSDRLVIDRQEIAAIYEQVYVIPLTDKEASEYKVYLKSGAVLDIDEDTAKILVRLI